jgi:ubiquinone/menaquinone biosynthesis C-methylase UbiE
MEIDEAYDHWSATYDSDANLTRDLDRAVTSETLAGLHVKTILEVGCGTGKNTAFLSLIGEEVLALDFSQGMLRKAEQKLRSSNVLFCAADVTKAWPCRAGSVDLVTCNLVLEHIESLPPVFAEAYRTLINGGRLFVSELHPFRQYQGTKASFEQAQKTVEITAFVHHLSDFFRAAEGSGFAPGRFQERWHAEDRQLPRLATFMFQK